MLPALLVRVNRSTELPSLVLPKGVRSTVMLELSFLDGGVFEVVSWASNVAAAAGSITSSAQITKVNGRYRFILLALKGW